MHQLLREATHAAHESLDGMFGSLDLTSREGYARFLSAHLIGMRALQAPFRRFVADELGLDAPDFVGMLEEDLAAIGLNPDALPSIAMASEMEASGITYVISGSRLGLAMIRKQEYWGKQAGTATSYMEDTNGLAVWRALVAWMNGHTPGATEAEAISAAARHAFDVFRQAFKLSGQSPPPAGTTA